MLRFVPLKIARLVALLCIVCFLFGSVSGCKRIRKLFRKEAPPPAEQKQAPDVNSRPAESAPAAPISPPPGISAGLPATLPALSGETQPTAAPPSGPPPPGPPSTSGDLTVSAGAEKKVAEGSYFQVDDAQALVPLARKLSFQWSVVQGPPEKLLVVKGNVLQGIFKLLDLEQPVSFVLRLTVTEGVNRASADVSVLGFPAKIVLKKHLGGITRQVERLGDKIFVVRGRTIEIYDAAQAAPPPAAPPPSKPAKGKGAATKPAPAPEAPGYALIDRVDLENPILELAGFSQQGKDYLYALTEAGEWVMMDVSDPKAVGSTMIQKSAASFKRLRVTTTPTGTWAVAVEKDKGLLWSIQDPAHPEMKLTLQGNYPGLREVVLWGKTLYLVDEKQLSSVDAGTGILSASLPVGGSAKALQVLEAGGKTYLVLGLGEERRGGARGDFGLRFFEIDMGGKLIRERRFGLKGNPAVESIGSIPGSPLILLGIRQKAGFGLRLFHLGTENEIPLETPADFKPAALLDLSGGGNTDAPLASLAEASAFRILKLVPVGNPPSAYKAETVRKSASTLAAGRIKMGPGESSVFLSDFGSGFNPFVPALLKIQAQDLNLQNALVPGDASYFPDFVLSDKPKLNFAANLNDLPSASAETLPSETRASQTQPALAAPQAATRPAETQGAAASETRPASGEGRGLSDGALRALSLDAQGIKSVLSPVRLFGEKKGSNESRILGLDLHIDAAGTTLAAAVGRTAGVGSRSGLMFLSLPPEADPELLFKSDLLSKTSFLPLNDARDVKLTADGKWALVAAGVEGLLLVDLEKKQVSLRMSGPPASVADRLLLSSDQKRVLVSYLGAPAPPTDNSAKALNPGVSIQVYYFDQGKLGLWGEIKGLSSVELPYAVRTPGLALSADDVYLYAANGPKGLWVFNLSDPSQPVLIAKLSTHGQAADVAVGQKYKNLYIADLVNGLEMAEFGF